MLSLPGYSGPIGALDKIKLCHAHFTVNDLVKALWWCGLAKVAHPEIASKRLDEVNSQLKLDDTELNFDDKEVLFELCLTYYKIEPAPSRWCEISAKLGNVHARSMIDGVYGAGYLDKRSLKQLMILSPNRSGP
ncbi:hypothetical protein N9J26_01255 [bacterium]|nr:hypothetical protein [bacterium]